MKKIYLLLSLLLIAITSFAADYYVAGTSSLCGSNWSNNDANNKMTLTNGVYTKTYTNVNAGSHEFKITNGTWDNAKGISKVDAATSTPGYSGNDNISFVLTAPTTITISYNETTDKISLKAEGIDRFGAFTISSYTLCGDFPCFNGDWDPANKANDMIDNNGTWTKSYENVNLDARIYEYKVAANNNWGQGEFPTSGNNNYEIKEAGSYNLTFTYNPSKPELTCIATLVGAVEKVLYPTNTAIYVTIHSQWLADNPRFAAYFFGSGEEWKNMTITENNIYSVFVPEGEWTGMIICRMNPETSDNTWDNLWGAQTKDIAYEEGKNHYIINSEDPTWDGNKPGGYWTTYGEDPGNNPDDNPGDNPGNNDDTNIDPNADSYTLCGDSILFGSHWNETDTNNDMVKGEDGIWTKEYTEVELTKGAYEYKVIANHTWGINSQYPTDDTNMTLYISKNGKYNIAFSFNPTTPELKAIATSTEQPVDVDNIINDNLYVNNGTIHSETNITIYSITGQNVTNLNGNLKNGVYIVKSANTTTKVVIK